MRLIIAARRSELARIQAYQVGDALAALPNISIEYSFHESLGDRNQTDPLWQMPEKGVFTSDLREGLLNGQFDLAVHSWKDLEVEENPDTVVAATLPRADMRDVLLIRSDRWVDVERTGTLRLLTSSPRRSHNLESFLPEVLPTQLTSLQFIPVRGNVPTRVRKLSQLDADGLVVAKAALDRLLATEKSEFAATAAELRRILSECRWMVLPLRSNPTAPGQGALAIEIKRTRNDLRDLLATINCTETYERVMRERKILRGFGGGCHQKIGVSVLRRPYGEITFLRGLAEDGSVLKSDSLCPSRPLPRRVLREQMWPQHASEANWFERAKFRVTIPDVPAALWISKADALPSEAQVSPAQIVWASGAQTWRQLAKRRIWVNGCAESLGEQEDPRIETLLGSRPKWLKLTHADGFAENGMQTLATYRLIPANGGPKFDGRTHFFWTSGSGFERAIALNPWLKQMTHFCGPGNTQRILERNGVQPFICLDHSQWLEELPR
ncbi:MAG TPA: hydroxymethylbilane synthase [Pyrinomonadaceae bacterium]|nr:hydroxymethylbilane synthase [Pyrinomonadaceae bacterium]